MHLRRVVTVCAFTAVGGLLPLSEAAAADWPQYRGPNRDGVSTEKVLTWPPVTVWERLAGSGEGIGEGYSSVAVSNGRVFAMGHVPGADGRGTDTVYCFDAATGAVLWAYSYECLSEKGIFGGGSTVLPPYPTMGEFGPRSTPTADENAVYTLSLDGHLFCLDAETGRVVWYRNAVDHLGATLRTYGCCSSPLVYGGKLILDLGLKCVALYRASGEVAWSYKLATAGFNALSPVVAEVGGRTCVLFGDRSLICARVEDGQKQWSYPMGRTATTAPVVAGDLLFFSTYPDWGTCAVLQMSGTEATEVWQGQVAADNMVRTYFFGNIVLDGYLYAMDNSGTEWKGNDDSISSLKCIKLDTGEWQWTEPGMGWANPMVAGGDLLILRETGELRWVAANTSGYAEIDNPAQVIDGITWTAPALAGGRLYCRNYKGDLKCLFVAPAVTIEATDPLALETTDDATFTVARTCAVPASPPATPLTVNIAIGGTEEDTDYNLTGGSVTETTVTISANEASVDITVTPLSDGGDTDDETVIITVQPGDDYVVGTHDSATVWIVDEAMSKPTVTIGAAGADGFALECGPDTGAFTVSRPVSADWPLVVDVSVSGDAEASDYTLYGTDGSTVVIPAGQTSAVITLIARNDTDNEGNETVTVDLQMNADYYTLGAEQSATVTIVDDDDAEVSADGDTMDDDWEKCYWGDETSHKGTADSDGDGLRDAGEYALGTDPTDTDTDKDGSADGEEFSKGTDPNVPTSYPEPAGDSGRRGGCAPGPAGAAGTPELVFLALALVVFRQNGARRRKAAAERPNP